jgi:hypothetical protein
MVRYSDLPKLAIAVLTFMAVLSRPAARVSGVGLDGRTDKTPTDRLLQIIPKQESPYLFIYSMKRSRDFVLLRCPEMFGLFGPGYQFKDTWQKKRWERIEGGGWSHTFGRKDDISYVCNLKPSREYVDVDLTISNQTNQPLKNVCAIICYDLRDAPQFYDYEMERTYIQVDHRYVQVKDTDRRYAKNGQIITYLLKGAEIPEVYQKEKQTSYGWGLSDTRPDFPLIATTSKDGKWVAATFFPQATTLLCNVLPPLRGCIHANPFLPLIRGGEKKTMVGRFYYFRGSLDDVFKRAKADLPVLMKDAAN